MKKSLLGVLALSSVLAVAGNTEHFHGFINSKSEASASKEGLKYDKDNKIVEFTKKDEFKAGVSNRTDLGLFFHENKDIFVFAGVDGLGYEWKKNGSLKSPNYYFGARWDAEIVDGWNGTVTFGHKHGGFEEKEILEIKDEEYKKEKFETAKYLEDAVRKHLKEKGKDHKAKDLEDYGYKLEAADKTTVISGVLSGRINDNVDIKVGSLYNTNDFMQKTHQLITFAKAKGNVRENVKFDSELRHSFNNKDQEKYGTMSGHVKFDSAVNEFDFANKLGFKVKGLKDAKHPFEIYTENSAKYKGIENVTLGLGIDYKAEVKDITTSEVKHIPAVSLNAKYDNGTVIASTKNKNSVEVEHKKNELENVTNKFETRNNVEYKGKMFGANLEAVYQLKAEYGEVIKEKPDLENVLLVKPGINVKYENEEGTLKINDKSSIAYLLKAYNLDSIEEPIHSLFLTSKNDVEYNLSDETTVKGNLNIYGYSEFNASVSDKYVKGGLIAIANPNAEVTHKSGKFTHNLKLDGVYMYGLGFDKNDSTKLNHNHSAGVVAELESKYAALDNVDVILGLKGDYGYNSHRMPSSKAAMKFIENSGYIENEYRDLQGYSEKLSKKEQKDIRAELDKYYVHNLEITPKVASTIKLVDGKVELTPALEGTIVFGQKNEKAKPAATIATASEQAATEKEDSFLLRKLEAKLSLDVKYSW